jgi:hypothetical protein
MVSFKDNFLIEFIIFILLFFISECYSSHISPCYYPVYRESQICGIQDPHIIDGFYCDPDSTVSMSEMQLIDENLRRIYRSKQDKCVCPDSVSQQCWYKFSFAFMREITPIEGTITNLHSSDHCPINASLHQPLSFYSMTPDAIQNYGQNYARIIRERWNFAECGEDFLILVIQRRPKSLSRLEQQQPIIFLSYGSIIHEKLTSLEAFSHLHSTATFHSIVENENLHLQNGYPLNRVLISLVGRIAEVLKEAEQIPKHSSKLRSHVPLWAWTVFGSCGILCILMAIGLYGISTTRRNSQRGKPIMAVNGRAWKAGFGDEQQAPTNVNLVQMLFPRPQQQQQGNNV